jgi:hypothetical protein
MPGFYTGHTAPATNRSDFTFIVELIDKLATGDFVDFDGAVITVALRVPSESDALAALQVSNLDGHVTILGVNSFQVHFTRDEMAMFPAGDADMGIDIKLADGITYPLFVGQVPIVDGIIRR